MLDQIIRVNKINLDEIKSIQGDQSVDWLSKILDELMEDLAPMNPVSKRYKGGLS